VSKTVIGFKTKCESPRFLLVRPHKQNLIGLATPISEIHSSFDHPFIVRVDSSEVVGKHRLIFMEVSTAGTDEDSKLIRGHGAALQRR
jgi:hypothetical protein